MRSFAGQLGRMAVVICLVGACDPAPAPGDVGIERIEITQGIQNILDQVPLIAGKPTFVRAFLRGNTEGGRTVPAVGARMIVDGGAPIGPIGVTSVVPPSTGSNWRRLDDSFLFQVPSAALGAGSHTTRIELVLPSGYHPSADAAVDAMVDVHLGPSGSPIALRVYGARYGYRNVPASLQARVGLTSSTWPAPVWDNFEPQRVGAEQMLPVASLSIDHLPTDAVTEVDCNYMGDAVTGGCAGYLDGRAWGEQTIDAAFPGGSQTIVVLQPEAGNGHYGAWYPSPHGNNVINIQADAVDIGATLAHEIGHSLGLVHTFEDPHYPRANGALGPYVALRGAPAPSLIPGDDAAGTQTASDIMSYNFTSWISPYNYCRALAATSGGRLTCPARLDSWDSR